MVLWRELFVDADIFERGSLVFPFSVAFFLFFVLYKE